MDKFNKMLEIEHQIKKHECKKSENRQTKVQREINESVIVVGDFSSPVRSEPSFGGEWIHVYVWLSPFAVHLK